MLGQPTKTQAIEAAVDYLVETENLGNLVKSLRTIVDNWSFRPVMFTGELEVLNPLIEVGKGNRATLDKLLDQASLLRKANPQRTLYQRNLMRERRARLAKAAQLANVESSERAVFDRDQLATWHAQRATYLKAKGSLTREEKSGAVRDFWAAVDARLDQALEGFDGRAGGVVSDGEVDAG